MENKIIKISRDIIEEETIERKRYNKQDLLDDKAIYQKQIDEIDNLLKEF